MRALLVSLSILCLSCHAEQSDPVPLQWRWELPSYVNKPRVPDDNLMSFEKIELGRHLFYETRLSLGGQTSCSSCHEQQYAFSVPARTNEGATGDFTSRNAQSLGNVGYASYLTWGNLTLRSLERQALNPLFGDNPIELGAGFIKGSSNHYDPLRLETLVSESQSYQRLFLAAFPDVKESERVTWDNAIHSLACFQRSMLSFDSPYDQYLAGDLNALSDAEERGRQLFFSEKTKCGQCHSGPLLSVAFPTKNQEPALDEMFRNTGLYYLTNGSASYFDGSLSYYPEPNMGIGEFSQNPADDGKHRVPSLRNIAVTAPYMHDGSIETLSDVLEHYAGGGRQLSGGPYEGDGRQNPNKDKLISGFSLTEIEKNDLVAFLHSLTDQTFITDPRYSDPHH